MKSILLLVLATAVSAGRLSEDYDPSVYADLLVHEDAVSLLKASGGLEKMSELGKIFVKYQLENVYGLELVHKHFDLTDDEVLVQSSNATVGLTVPWQIDEMNEVDPVDEEYWSSFDFQRKSFVNSHTWTFVDGQLKPYEYYESDFPGRRPPTEFADALYLELVNQGLERVFGIRQLIRTSFGDEASCELQRANIMRFAVDKIYEPKDIGETDYTFWTFGKAGNSTDAVNSEQVNACFICVSCNGNNNGNNNGKNNGNKKKGKF